MALTGYHYHTITKLRGSLACGCSLSPALVDFQRTEPTHIFLPVAGIYKLRNFTIIEPFYFSSNLLSLRWFATQETFLCVESIVSLQHEKPSIPLYGWTLSLARRGMQRLLIPTTPLSKDQEILPRVGPFEMQWQSHGPDGPVVIERKNSPLPSALRVPLGPPGSDNYLWFFHRLQVTEEDLKTELLRFKDIPALEARTGIKVSNDLDFNIAVMIVWAWTGWTDEEKSQKKLLLSPQETWTHDVVLYYPFFASTLGCWAVGNPA
ncbi:hypothetical protein FB446DRAFT_710012 [Lentinula raphanica]|nr:hypothetical protein FB446DRAFT_710012 [Lentinula raphanica]